MRSVSTIFRSIIKSVFFLLLSINTFSQENSPYSRYGLGDVNPTQNIVNRAMGGAASTYGNFQSINFSNPASFSELKIVTYDVGVTIDSRSLKSSDLLQKYKSVNVTPSYVALGMPISKRRNIGLSFGLRSLSRISYSIEEGKRIGQDTINYLYKGDGGLYQAFIGIGKRWKGLRVGINTGYMFGRKEISTITTPLDSFQTYMSNSSTLSTYGSGFLSAGVQYEANLSKTTSLRLAFAGNLKHDLNATRQVNRETFMYDANGSMFKIDSIYTPTEEKGKIQLPVNYSAGISINKYSVDQFGNKYDKGLFTVEYETTKWSDYRFFNQPDRLGDSWFLKAGGQFVPTANQAVAKNYWSRVTYRAGFYYGNESLQINGNKLPVYAITFGTGFPVRKWSSFDNQYTNINTSFEIGKRGNSTNPITESFFRMSVGLNLSDIWFIKRRYD